MERNHKDYRRNELNRDNKSNSKDNVDPERAF